MAIEDIRKSIPKHPTRKWGRRNLTKIRRIWVHCTAGTNQNPNDTAAYHIKPSRPAVTACPACGNKTKYAKMKRFRRKKVTCECGCRFTVKPRHKNHISSRGAPGVCYHDYIRGDGQVFRCNDYESITWHTKGWNRAGVGVVLAFQGQTGQIPPSPQFSALIQHVAKLCLYLKVSPVNVKGHRESLAIPGGKGPVRYKKACPGMGINLDMLRHLVTIRVQKLLADHGYYKGVLSGAWDAASQDALNRFNPNAIRKS